MAVRAALVAAVLVVPCVLGTGSASAAFGPYPTPTFSDGFETGGLDAWDGAAGTGTASVLAAAAHTGSSGLRIANTASGQFEVVTKSLLNPVADSSTTFWIRPGSGGGVQSLAQARDASSASTMWAILYDGNQHALWFYPFNNSISTEIFTGANTVPANQWTKVEVQYSAVAAGGAQLFLNDQTQPSWGVTGNYTRVANLQKLQLWSDGTAQMDFDDVLIATPASGSGGGTVPDPPTGVAGAPANGAAVLTWTAPATDGGNAIIGYRVTPYIGSAAQTPILTNSPATSYRVTGLTNGTTYTFTVAAINGVGTGADSAASPAVTPAVLNPIQVENSLPGDPNWGNFAAPPDPTGLSGYGSKISVNLGSSIDFYVTTTAPSFNIDVYRMGWYGGAGARLMQSMGTFPGVNQPQANPDPVMGMVSENWSKTATLNVPTSWTSGVYLARLMSSTGYGAMIIFVVRDDASTAPIVMQTSVNTYQAYNAYGGTSLYNNNTNHSIYTAPHAMKVSYDRPFLNGDGAGQFLSYEYQFVRWAEKRGYDMTYQTDVDTHTGSDPLTHHKAFIVLGHDEYWSKAQRDNVEGAIAAGVNAAFFAGNESYWQVRFEPNAAGDPNRVMVGYKDFANCACPPGPDPLWNQDNSQLTGLWRDPQVGRPEEQMMGVQFGGEAYGKDYVVKNSGNWVYAGTGWTDGTVVPGIIGYEYDHYFADAQTPANITVLSNSPVTNEETGQPDTANSTIYTAPSGAQVFAAGTIQWGWGLDNFGGNGIVNTGLQRVTDNILSRFATGPSGGGGGANPPGAPTGVSGTPGDSSVALTWTAPTSNGGNPITGYRITPYLGTTALAAIPTGSASTSFTVTGLSNGSAYTFTIAAANAAGTGPDSAPSSPITPVGLPGAPTGVTGVAGDQSVSLTWTAPAATGGSPVTGYRITPSQAGTALAPIPTGSAGTSFTVTGLTNGAAYTFTVAAITSVGTGPDSSPSTAVTPGAVLAGAPTAVSGSAGDSSVALTWTAPASDGGSAISSYRITPYLGPTALASIPTGSATTGATVTGLSNGSAYTFTVAAVNAAGTGPDSAPSSPVTPVGLPGAPTGVAGVDHDRSVALSWTAPASTGGSPITGYRVTPSQGGTTLASIATGSSGASFTVTGLTNGTAYTFTVAAITSVGTGPDSTASAAVTPVALPGAPTGVSGTAGNASVALSWSAPSTDGGSAITRYRITPYIGTTAQTAVQTTTAATSFTVTGLTNGTAYTFTVAAVNGVGTGPDSAASSAATPATTPGAPTGVAGTSGNASVALTWTAPANTGGSAITGYQVTPRIAGVAQTPVLTGSNATSFTVTGLTNGAAYTFVVAAINAAGTGANSSASASITPATVPGAPTNVAGTSANASVRLTWTAPASNGGRAITRYRITPYIGGTAQTPVQTTSTSTTFTVTGLTNGTAYTFTVAATNAVGTGADSTPSAAVTPLVPVRLVQSRTLTPAASSTPSGAFNNSVASGDTLVGAFALGGAGASTVTSVTDSQGNTWARAAMGNGDLVRDDAEIWYATARATGNDTVTLHLGGSVRTNVTLAEFSAGATVDVTSTSSQTLSTTHGSGTTPPAAQPGDFVVGVYVDAGANTAVSITDGKTVLGRSVGPSTTTQSDQSYLIAAAAGAQSAVFGTTVATTASVAVAAFAPH
jgi:titin